MNRKTWTIWLGIVAASLLAPQVQAQGYSSGGTPMLGNIQTLCVEPYPAPQTRTDVGIGEEVTCSIDPSTWQAQAIYTDSYGNQSYVNDPLGSITWNVSGPGTVYPTVGDSTTLTIDLVDEAGPVTLYALAVDALAVDPPVQRMQPLNAQIPTSVSATVEVDVPPAAWKKGMANLGAKSQIYYQVQPDTANFNKVSFRTNWPAIPNYKWPNGTPAPKAASVGKTFNTVSNGDGGVPNITAITLTQSLQPVGLIAGQDWTFNWAATLERLNDENNWVGVGGVGLFVGVFQFKGVSNQTQVGLTQAAFGTNQAETLLGSLQGPWQ